MYSPKDASVKENTLDSGISPIDTLAKKQSILPIERQYAEKKKISRRHPIEAASSLSPDSSAISDSASSDRSEESSDSADNRETSACENDTTEPWVYTDPSGGLHYTAIAVRLFATKPSAIEWKSDSAGQWKAYNGEEIPIEKTTTLFLKASDSCGNKMPQREEFYELRRRDTSVYCPPDMERVLVGAMSFCMDRYEWPNKKGAIPRSYVSVYQAMDTCVAAGKRLCTSDEWTIACTGPYGWKYPYGAKYEIHACVTNDTTPRPSGSKTECRGYFGIYDMSGNCAEWTNTKSNKNSRYYNIRGGFWESGLQSGCFDVRYSYFPQNRHNPVGFRCCKDAARKGPQNGAE
jgi:hypothetical protein